MADNKKYVELLWAEKYDKYEKGEKIPIEKPNLPFQVVETVNKPRLKDLEGGLFDTSKYYPEAEYPENYTKDWRNLLIWGDNKLVMSSLIKQGWAGKINLIYIDPPFFTGADFTIRTRLGDDRIEKEPSIIEERAYKDTWSGGIASYLRYMYERLVLMRELLAENGSIYVHLDWHVGHYVKVMMDEIFGAENFRNEIIWHYDIGGRSPVEFARKHDTILIYEKNPGAHYFSSENIRIPYKTEVKGRKDPLISPEKYARGKIPTNVWNDIPINLQMVERMDFQTQKPSKLLERIIFSSCPEGGLMADFFCGSGTTLAVTEKLGRRWIGSDLSKFAIQVTRKRQLDIHNSKDLQDEGKQYGKPARPFELWNIGNYETVYWQEKQHEYLTFMLRLYQAQLLTGFRYLHGRKGDRAVHVGPLNAPVTMEEVEKVVIECRANNFYKADVLGWDWSYEVNELGKELAKKNGVDLRLIQIPSVNEIKSALVGFDLRLLKIPDEAIEKDLAKYVKFAQVAYLEIETKVKNKEVALQITDFQIAPTAELAEIATKVRDSRELIDYWAIDWNHKGDTFHNQWQSFRTKKNPKVDYKARHR